MRGVRHIITQVLNVMEAPLPGSILIISMLARLAFHLCDFTIQIFMNQKHVSKNVFSSCLLYSNNSVL